MKFINENANLFIPDGQPEEEAIRRTTHMAIGAHQDDLEIMAYDGILKCFGQENQWFFGVVVTDGAGSPRDGLYENYTDEEMRVVRKFEQRKAAMIGEYGALVQLAYASSEVKSPNHPAMIEELKRLISHAKPRVIYTHNLADKHETHVAVAIKVIQAIRALPENKRPEKLYGCEIWRNLDWMNDEEKAVFDVSAHPNLAMALLEVFDSQICGGKRYDLATEGRRMANATYASSHSADKTTSAIYAMDLTPLVHDTTINIDQYIQGYIHSFQEDVMARIKRLLETVDFV